MQVEDVLGREPVRMEVERVGAYLRDRVVLVTGAGGSIGSELCRQIARVRPARLVLVDHAEDNLFEIQRELSRTGTSRPRVSVLADCKEEERMREVFAEHRPTVVFHAAAYKHVRADGGQPRRGGAQQRARHARGGARSPASTGVETFVLVSTDKAVDAGERHGRLQGARRVGVEAAAARTRDALRAVRFGNVLGSSGSVVPIFRRQIAAGGPVTVTDRAMTRYFMTIPEAVQLVIRAGSLGARRRGVRARDGRAGRIIDLAEDMIRSPGSSRSATSRSRSSARGRARSSTRSCSTSTSARSRRRPRRSCAPTGRGWTPPGWRTTFDEHRPARARGRRRPVWRPSLRSWRACRLEPEEAVVLTTSPPAAQEADGATA